jgi:L-amino acid N-acyltransferase YncA
MEIKLFEENHWFAVQSIYEEGIATGNATMETKCPEWESWDAAHTTHSRWVAIENNEVLGWAALSPVSERCVFAGVAEVSVYVSKKVQGKGIGLKLLEKLITSSEQAGIWTLQSGILDQNEASLKLHQKAGFRVIGYREKIGQLNGKWRDINLLERRSSKLGI